MKIKAMMNINWNKNISFSWNLTLFIYFHLLMVFHAFTFKVFYFCGRIFSAFINGEFFTEGSFVKIFNPIVSCCWSKTVLQQKHLRKINDTYINRVHCILKAVYSNLMHDAQNHIL